MVRTQPKIFECTTFDRTRNMTILEIWLLGWIDIVWGNFWVVCNNRSDRKTESQKKEGVLRLGEDRARALRRKGAWPKDA